MGFNDTVWTEQFRQHGYGVYEKPTMVLFSEKVRTEGCGTAPSAVGPFYCPADQNVYLDTQFFRELEMRFQAPGEFAEAYVIAHEVGHHVQNLVGWSDRVHAAQQRASQPRHPDRVQHRPFTAGGETQECWCEGRRGNPRRDAEARRERSHERAQQQGREAGPLEGRRGIRVKGELEERDGGDGSNEGDSARALEGNHHGVELTASGL